MPTPGTVALMHRILELHRRLAAAQTSTDKILFGRQISATDKEIALLVYGLTEEETGIVEGKRRRLARPHSDLHNRARGLISPVLRVGRQVSRTLKKALKSREGSRAETLDMFGDESDSSD
jgi:hypothetical protein